MSTVHKTGPAYLYRWLKIKVVSFLDLWLARLRSGKSAVLSITPGLRGPGNRNLLCVFAHFDRDDIVDDHVLHYLGALDAAGAEIIFCSTAEGLGGAEIEKLRPLCGTVIVRRNLGYDFASYRTGLAAAGDLSRYDAVILANDSVYGPLRDLKAIFAAMADKDADFWGITDSTEFGHHLQSYFLVFRKAVATSALFHEFWRRFPDFRAKLSVIAKGELGLSKTLVAGGFRIGALCGTSRILAENPALFDRRAAAQGFLRGKPLNLSHHDWRLLIERYGSPFIKIELLRDNPKSVADVAEWETVARDAGDYDPRLIHNHLRRMRQGDESTLSQF